MLAPPVEALTLSGAKGAGAGGGYHRQDDFGWAAASRHTAYRPRSASPRRAGFRGVSPTIFSRSAHVRGDLRIGHPSGIVRVAAAVETDADDGVHIRAGNSLSDRATPVPGRGVVSRDAGWGERLERRYT